MCVSDGLSLRSNQQAVPGQRSTSKKTADLDKVYLEPAIWSRDTGQRITCFDRCQLTITLMSNIKDTWRQCGPVVRALALRSGDPGFKTRSDHSLNLILVVPGSTSQLHL